MLSSSSSSAWGSRAPLDHVLVVFVAVDLGLVGDLFLFLDRRAGDLLADLAFAARFAALFGLVELFGGRALRQHRLEVDDLAQLHAPLVEGVGPANDRVEGDRAFAQAPDHRVAAGLDALGDRDLAFAGEQFHRAHLAQVHAHGVVGAVGRLFLGRRRGAGTAVVERVDLVLDLRLGVLVVLLVVALFGILDDRHAALRKARHDVLDRLVLIGRDRGIDLVDGDVPRFSARCIIFLIDASLRSISGASPSSTVSTSWGSFFAMLIRRLIGAGKLRQPLS